MSMRTTPRSLGRISRGGGSGTVIQLPSSIVGPYMTPGFARPAFAGPPETCRIGMGNGRSNNREFCASADSVQPPVATSALIVSMNRIALPCLARFLGGPVVARSRFGVARNSGRVDEHHRFLRRRDPRLKLLLGFRSFQQNRVSEGGIGE